MLPRALLLVFSGLSVCLAQPQYQFLSLTGSDVFRVASATRLSQSGSAIGQVDGDGKAAVFSRELGTIKPAYARQIKDINAAGDIIGVTNQQKPFLSRPPYDTYLDLSPVSGSENATPEAMNDRGDIVGEPFYANGWFPGLNITILAAINNAGQVIGAVPVFPGYQYFLYTPGKGAVPLPAPPNTMNNNGDLLFGAPGAQYIQNSSGMIPLPSCCAWTGMNDFDEAVGSVLGANPQDPLSPRPVFYSVPTGLIDLTTRFQNTSGIAYPLPVGINNRGEILLEYSWFPAGFAIPAVGIGLLTPVSGAR